MKFKRNNSTKPLFNIQELKSNTISKSSKKDKILKQDIASNTQDTPKKDATTCRNSGILYNKSLKDQELVGGGYSEVEERVEDSDLYKTRSRPHSSSVPRSLQTGGLLLGPAPLLRTCNLRGVEVSLLRGLMF